MFREKENMDVIKTSLIVAIGVTLYYLLLQWPVSPASMDNELTNTNELISINESERSIRTSRTAVL